MGRSRDTLSQNEKGWGEYTVGECLLCFHEVLEEKEKGSGKRGRKK